MDAGRLNMHYRFLYFAAKTGKVVAMETFQHRQREDGVQHGRSFLQFFETIQCLRGLPGLQSHASGFILLESELYSIT